MQCGRGWSYLVIPLAISCRAGGENIEIFEDSDEAASEEGANTEGGVSRK